MHTYRVIATLSVGEGTILHLTEEQAKSRLHNLMRLDEGHYRATTVLQFKRGEVVVMEQALPKGSERYAEHVTGDAPAEDPRPGAAPAGDPAPSPPPADKPSGKKKGFFRK